MTARYFAVVLLGLLTCYPALGQRHADLNPVEVDQLRDTAMEPDKRLKLYLTFARERLAKLEQVRTDLKLVADDRATATHDGLQNFLDIYDELNDNIDMYVDRKNDIRKPLKAVLEADTEFETKLKAFQDSAAASKENTKAFDFVLTNALDTLRDSINDHRQLMQEQEEAAKHKKIKKQ